MSAMQYSAFFNVRDVRHNFGSVTFSAAGETDFTINISELVASTLDGSRTVHVFNHYFMNFFVNEEGEGITTLDNVIAAGGLGEVMTQRMRSVGSSWADSDQLGCVVGGDDPRYAFNYYGHTFTAITFSNIHTRRLFGFEDDATDESESIIGTRLPNFIIEPVLTSITMEDTEGYVYEAAGITAAAMSMGGVQYGFTRPAVPLYRDWVQQSETRAKVLREAAQSTHPFTHQLLFESCRSVLPFAVINGFDDGYNYLFKLRVGGCMWDLNSCKRAGSETDHALFDVRYRAQQLASYVANS